MTLRVVWDRLNVEIAKGKDKDGRPQYEDRILTRGDEIPAAVTDFNRSLYLSIGAAKDDGQAVAVVQQATEQEFNPIVPNPVLTPDQPPNPTAPSGGVTDASQQQQEADTPADPANLPDRPDDGARKDVWEDYAVKLGIDRARAESLTKAKLIAEADAKRAEVETPA